MKRNMFNHSRNGLPEIGCVEIHVFAKERYNDLLREAEQYRLERRLSASQQAARHIARSPIAHLLIWAGILR